MKRFESNPQEFITKKHNKLMKGVNQIAMDLEAIKLAAKSSHLDSLGDAT